MICFCSDANTETRMYVQVAFLWETIPGSTSENVENWNRTGRKCKEHNAAAGNFSSTPLRNHMRHTWYCPPGRPRSGWYLSPEFHVSLLRVVPGDIAAPALPSGGGLSGCPGGREPQTHKHCHGQLSAFPGTQTGAQRHPQDLLQDYKHHKISAFWIQQSALPKELMKYPSHWKAKVQSIWTSFLFSLFSWTGHFHLTVGSLSRDRRCPVHFCPISRCMVGT